MSQEEVRSDSRSVSELIDTTQGSKVENKPKEKKDKKKKTKDKKNKKVKKTKRQKSPYALWSQRSDKKTEIKSYLEILDSFEYEHRSDLSLHLYSTFLLKKLIRKANERKFPLETESYLKERLSDDMIKWPNKFSVVDPKVDKFYEDNPPKVLENDILNEAAARERLVHNSLELNKSDVRNNLPIDIPVTNDLIPGEVSERAMKHAANMMNIELNAMWGRKLKVSAKRAGVNLDIDKMTIPSEICSNILGKLDRVMNGLHLKMAEKNEIDVEKVSSEEEEEADNDGDDDDNDIEEEDVDEGNNSEIITEEHDSHDSIANDENEEDITTTNSNERNISQQIEPELSLDRIKRRERNRQIDIRRRANREKGQERVTYLHHFDEVNENQNVKYRYHEILDRCFEMNQDMKDIYMKSLKLFNDIPNGYRKKDYKIKADTLKEYRMRSKRAEKPCNSLKARQFYKVHSLIEDKEIPPIRKTLLDILTRKDTEHATEWKTFVQVQENQRKLHGEDRVTYPTESVSEDAEKANSKMRSSLLNTIEPYVEKWNETNPDEYNIIDCLLPVPVSNHKKSRFYDYTSDEFQ